MAMLYDHLVRDDVVDSDCVVVSIDNVADYYANNDTIKPIVSPEQFPCIRPPYQKMYFEYKSSNSWGSKIPTYGLIKRIGIEIQTEKDFFWDGRINHEDNLIRIKVYLSLLNKKPWPLKLEFGILCDSNGILQPEVALDGKPGMYVSIPDDYSEVYTPDMCSNIILMIFPAFFAISLMHCKNTKITPIEPPEKLLRKSIKKHGKPLCRYHVLNIEPMKAILRSEGNIEKNGLKKALHICRGHFKDYRDGKGLFGKYRDIYWWDSYARGDITEGAVIKDYKISV
jgi:hypothetical protein